MARMVKKRMEGNISKLCWMNLFDGMQFSLPIFAIFLLGNGMSLTQMGLIVGASYLVAFVLDIPFSILADKRSRRSFLIMSNMCFMLLNLIFFLSHSFGMFFIGYCFNGLGTALTSGIAGAFVYDTLLSLGEEKQYEKTQAEIAKYRFAGKILASLTGVYLYYLDPRLPFLLQAGASLVCILICFGFREPAREKSVSKSLDQIKEGFAYLQKQGVIWNAILVFSVVESTYDVLANYYQPVMESSGIPIDCFGVIYVLVNVIGLLGAGYYSRIKSSSGWREMMAAYLFVNLVASVFFGARISGLVVLAIALLTFASGSYDIYIGNIIHQIVPSSHRATTLSIRSQIFNLFFFIFMYIVSFSVDHGSMLVGMLVNAVIILIATMSFLRVGRREPNVLSIE